MLTQGEDVEAQALRGRGWSISAIARHLNRDPKTIRAYLSGQRCPGERASTRPDPLAPFVAYLSARFVDDPHLWATALFDEVVPLGYGGSYVSFARQLRKAGLRPHCEACAGVNGRDTIEIEHPAGAEMQWDWFERRKAPWGGTVYVLLGTLPHSSRVRGVLAESLDQAHLIEGIDAVLRRHGGTPRVWRTDRLATVIVPGTRDVQPSFAPVAKHYGAIVQPCPPRRGNRKGAVESSVRYLCGRWWRTMTATTPEEAQRCLDAFCAGPGDARTAGAQRASRRGQRDGWLWRGPRHDVMADHLEHRVAHPQVDHAVQLCAGDDVPRRGRADVGSVASGGVEPPQVIRDHDHAVRSGYAPADVRDRLHLLGVGAQHQLASGQRVDVQQVASVALGDAGHRRYVVHPLGESRDGGHYLRPWWASEKWLPSLK